MPDSQTRFFQTTDTSLASTITSLGKFQVEYAEQSPGIVTIFLAPYEDADSIARDYYFEKQKHKDRIFETLREKI